MPQRRGTHQERAVRASGYGTPTTPGDPLFDPELAARPAARPRAALEPRETLALARRGVPAGRSSRAFSAAELRAALLLPPRRCVLAELDAAGHVVCAGGGLSGPGGALLAAHARLAASPALGSVALRLAGPGLRLQVRQDLAPLDELLLWPDEALLARAGVPPAPDKGDGEWAACGECGALLPSGAALRLHRFLRCAAPAARALLGRLAGALLNQPAGAPRPGARHECPLCGKAYSRRYGLKIHIRTHTGYKPLRCRHCARAFGDPSNLNKHVRLHAAGGRASLRVT